VRCIKDENGKVLFENADIKERWQMHFSKLLNDEVLEDFRIRSGVSESSERHLDL